MTDNDPKKKRATGPRTRGAKPKYDTRVSVAATCHACGKTTQTPFVPREPDRVLCAECYAERFGRPAPGQPETPRHGLHAAVCSECGEPCEIPWKPKEGDPAICWDCRKGVARNPQQSKLDGATRTGGGRVVRVRKKKD